MGVPLSGRAVATRHLQRLPLRAHTGRSIAHASHQLGLLYIANPMTKNHL